jgi:hypothetical protein
VDSTPAMAMLPKAIMADRVQRSMRLFI